VVDLLKQGRFRYEKDIRSLAASSCGRVRAPFVARAKWASNRAEQRWRRSHDHDADDQQVVFQLEFQSYQ
jgi:hypothetical protein